MPGPESKNSAALYAQVVDKSDVKAFYRQSGEKDFNLEKFVSSQLQHKAENNPNFPPMYNKPEELQPADVSNYLRALKNELALHQGVDAVDTKREKKFETLFGKIESYLSTYDNKVKESVTEQVNAQKPEIAKEVQASHPIVKIDDKGEAVSFDKAYPKVGTNNDPKNSQYSKFVADNVDKVMAAVNSDNTLRDQYQDAQAQLKVLRTPVASELDDASKKMQAKLDKFAAATSPADISKDNRANLVDGNSLQTKIREVIQSSDIPGKDKIVNDPKLNDNGKIGAYTLAALKKASPEIYNQVMEQNLHLKDLMKNYELNDKGQLVDSNTHKQVSGAEVYSKIKDANTQGNLVGHVNNAIEKLHDASSVRTSKPLDAKAIAEQEKIIAGVVNTAATRVYDTEVKGFRTDVDKKINEKIVEGTQAALSFEDKDAMDRFKAQTRKLVKSGELNGADGINTETEKALAIAAKRLGMDMVESQREGGGNEFHFKAGPVDLGEVGAFAAKAGAVNPNTVTPSVEGAKK